MHNAMARPLPCCHACRHALQVVPNFRVRTIPVLGTTPAIFGMAAASYILCQLAGAPFQGEPIFSLGAAMAQRQLDRLQEREKRR